MTAAFALTRAATARAGATATPDETLIEMIRDGNQLAMQLLFTRHHVKIYRFILRMVRNEAGAEDLTADVFVDVWRLAGRFEGRSQVTTWLLAIARNKALSSMRGRSLDLLDDDAVDAIEDTSATPDVELEAKDRSAMIRDCLTQLSAAHREIVDLVYYHEKSIEEIAEILGVPENTVKTRMFYARKRLAELLRARGCDSVYN